MSKWTTDNIPNLAGKTAIITGGNIGLGYQIGLELARKNAKIVIACRTVEKGLHAVSKIEQTLSRKIESDVFQLDLTNVESIKKFSDEFQDKNDRLDILVNNAGVVSLPERQETHNGTEMHLATNHLGHFALTGLLLPQIKRTPHARVITMSSGGYLFATLDFDDMNWQKREYDKVKCYGASKFANLLFMVELDRLFKQNNYSALSIGAHPGLSATKGQQKRAEGLFFRFMAQPVAMGALPALMGATADGVHGKSYYGPQWGLRGYPKLEKLKAKVLDTETARKLWEFSELATGIKYTF